MKEVAASPWYRDGLRFECHRCGRCCRGAGNVWLEERDVPALATALEVDEEELLARYTRRSGRRGRVLRQQRNQDCVFWDPASGCRVYAARPRQCRTYPFWSALLHSPESFAAEGRSCPGIGEGPLHEAAAIARLAEDDGIPPARTRLGRERG